MIPTSCEHSFKWDSLTSAQCHAARWCQHLSKVNQSSELRTLGLSFPHFYSLSMCFCGCLPDSPCLSPSFSAHSPCAPKNPQGKKRWDGIDVVTFCPGGALGYIRVLDPTLEQSHRDIHPYGMLWDWDDSITSLYKKSCLCVHNPLHSFPTRCHPQPALDPHIILFFPYCIYISINPFSSSCLPHNTLLSSPLFTPPSSSKY